MNLLIELRQIDINNTGSWPVAFKVSALVILFVAIIFAGYFFVWEEQVKVLEDAQTQEETPPTLEMPYLIIFPTSSSFTSS